MLGVLPAQQILRRLGHADGFPPAADHGLRMVPAPHGVCAHASICVEPLIS
ncbi:MAG TPA: hypothetical protein VGN83_19560 [Falsiroseomonas sp.]|jgi:hypothetical protein|nr:hypothetical protein [Falsiroseomonas sp.]